MSRKSFKLRAQIDGENIRLTGLRPAVRGRHIQNGVILTTRAELRAALDDTKVAAALGLKPGKSK